MAVFSSYPNGLLIEELQTNPELGKLIVEKILDDNGDGEVSADEFLQRVYK